MTEHLTDAEREALVAAHVAAINAKGGAHLIPAVESIVAARLEQQREALAAAIEGMPQTVMSPRKAALTIREYQPGERCTCVGMDEKPGCDHRG